MPWSEEIAWLAKTAVAPKQAFAPRVAALEILPLTEGRTPHVQHDWALFDSFRLPGRPAPLPPRCSVFDGFERPQRSKSWQGIQMLVDLARAYATEKLRDLPGLLDRWDKKLEELGGDPSKTDWSGFRPLRLECEGDWSDWLQHFIKTSETGAFSEQLLSRVGLAHTIAYASPKVDREHVAQDRRADLVIKWADGSLTSVEVKVGDQGFAKTADTAAKLERKHPGSWTHYLLLPSTDLGRWKEIELPAQPPIHFITWDEVALALRRSLWRREESPLWRAWAHGFCGLVEQKMLGIPTGIDRTDSLSTMERRLHQISIMEKGIING